MSDEQVYLIEEDVEEGMLGAAVMKRGFPRFWRKRVVGVAPANAYDRNSVPIGVVVKGGKKGEEARLLIRGRISLPKKAPKLTRWQRLKSAIKFVLSAALCVAGIVGLACVI